MDQEMSPRTRTLLNEMCDVGIKADGVEFQAHKSILCDCSPYFRALFTYSWHDSDKKVYDIPGISPDIMELILQYAYTKTAHINTDNVEDLFIAADYLNILGLVRLCSEFLRSQLCPQNCIGIFKFTEYYYCPELHQEAYQYVLHNIESIMKTSDEFLDLSAVELEALIDKDKVNLKQEEETF